MIVTEREREREREREAETQAEGEAGSMHREPDVGSDPGSPGSRPEPKAGTKLLRHPGIPKILFLSNLYIQCGAGTQARDQESHAFPTEPAGCHYFFVFLKWF